MMPLPSNANKQPGGKSVIIGLGKGKSPLHSTETYRALDRIDFPPLYIHILYIAYCMI